MTDLPRAWWHGCWGGPGHVLMDTLGRSVRRDGSCPFVDIDDGWLDGGLAPRILRPRAWLPNAPFAIPDDRIVFSRMAGDVHEQRYRLERESEECPQGQFLLRDIRGCTIAAWWDRTQGDERGACNSCFIVENYNDDGWSVYDIRELLPQLFPRQAERLADAGIALRFLRWA